MLRVSVSKMFYVGFVLDAHCTWHSDTHAFFSFFSFKHTFIKDLKMTEYHAHELSCLSIINKRNSLHIIYRTVEQKQNDPHLPQNL